MSKVNILAVDDRPEGLLSISAVLNSPDYNLVTASSGNEALKHLLNNDFAVILLDVQMPEMNGFETATLIKTRNKSKDIPIIFLSAINQDEHYVYQGYEVGAVDYLLKPFDPHILKAKVAVFVDLFKKKQVIKDQAQRLYQNEIEQHAIQVAKLELKSLKSYQQLADSIPQIVFRLVSDGSYEYFNKVWFEYTGLSEVTSFGLSWKDVIHPDDFRKLIGLFDNAHENDSIEGECRILNKHGEFRWHLFRIHSEPQIDNENLYSWLGTATDIEDRKRIEDGERFLSAAGEALITSLDQNLMLENISKVCVPYLANWCSFDLVDEEGDRIMSLVHHRDSKKNSMTKNMMNLYLNHPSSQKGTELAIASRKIQVLKSAGLSIHRFEDLNEEEGRLAAELSETTLMIIPLIAQKKVLGTLTLASYDEQKKFDQRFLDLAEELGHRVSLAFENYNLYKISQEAIEARNDFFSIASHELNTPITSMKLQLQKVKRKLANFANEEEVNKFSHSIDTSIKQIDRLVNLVQVLLDVSHIHTGKFNFIFEDFSLKEMVSEVVERQKEMLKKHNCELSVDNAVNRTVHWDKTRIEQVIGNLITNAIKYAPGKIHLSVKEEDGHIKIAVRDFGRGIPKNKLASIFDRFERVDTGESITGLGLGLFIVKQIVEGHRGRIAIDSEINKGSCFEIILPLK